MCGRFVLTQSSEAIADTFKVEVPDFLPRYNIAPSSAIAGDFLSD
jgi:putative SOS response-associated peptidase YedK